MTNENTQLKHELDAMQIERDAACDAIDEMVSDLLLTQKELAKTKEALALATMEGELPSRDEDTKLEYDKTEQSIRREEQALLVVEGFHAPPAEQQGSQGVLAQIREEHRKDKEGLMEEHKNLQR
ncbi:hypothetical protein BDZ45DRAFT_699950 [Acephala macrosclerotiorum]|nr:hypothetical protein BDZ45DRAFT_699950 [Acephala macrosclerotiorum]